MKNRFFSTLATLLVGACSCILVTENVFGVNYGDPKPGGT